MWLAGLEDILIPDLISLILDYLSLVELTEIGLSRPDPMSEHDQLAFKMYTRGKVNTFKADFIHAAPRLPSLYYPRPREIPH